MVKVSFLTKFDLKQLGFILLEFKKKSKFESQIFKITVTYSTLKFFGKMIWRAMECSPLYLS